MEGYWAIGDGGGGSFYWDSSSSSGENGVTPMQPVTVIVPNGSTSGRRMYNHGFAYFRISRVGTSANEETQEQKISLAAAKV